MLGFLVTSKTRRSLLKLLWGDGRQGTTADFSRWAKVAFAGAHKELNAMEEAGLAESVWKDGRRLYRKVKDHPQGVLLKALLKNEGAPARDNAEKMTEVKQELTYLGLPVNAIKRPPGRDETLESVLASACHLARNDASVARSLPVLLEKYKRQVDFANLEKECRKLGQRHAMGFFLELTGRLSNDDQLARHAEQFRDLRRKRLKHFFSHPTKLSRRVSSEKTPELAKKWGWLMNISLDSFASTFDKFNDASLPAS